MLNGMDYFVLGNVSDSISRNINNAERNKYGFVFWLISNMYMTVRFAVIGEYAQMVLFFVYFLLAIRGLFAWSKKEKVN